MKKRWITCIVFLSLGTVLALAGAIGMKFDFSYYNPIHTVLSMVL